ncbi:MAG: response regulator [Candidatus Omnitrophica bacterium]|nr:response regulator [Candidatus Omnitrophota bacterium]
METKFKILLVDDEQDFIEPIAFWLEAKGYSVRMALNGEDGLKLIEQETPDIVLLDINMPVMNGTDTLKNIRIKHQTLPVIMITAELEQLPIFQDLGISGFFPKGGTLTQLEQLLDPVIRIHARMKPSK